MQLCERLAHSHIRKVCIVALTDNCLPEPLVMLECAGG